MVVLKLVVCSIFLVLLSSGRTLPRPLNPVLVESRKLSGTSLQDSIRVSKEAFEANMNEKSSVNAQDKQPARVSPGGPDPVHHS